jgi:hypothetical protein
METQKYISLGKHIIRFGGQSHWSTADAKDVEVHVVVDYVDDPENDYESASVLAMYETDQWNAFEDGDIYTDAIFKEQVRAIVTEAGYSNQFGYSESGMQSEKYVHFDLAVNDKLKADESNCVIDWEGINAEIEAAQLERELRVLDMRRNEAYKKLCELKKKYHIK